MKGKTNWTPKLFQGNDKLFKDACSLASVSPTKRQFSRWKQERGQAFAKKAEAQAMQQASPEVEAA